MKPDRTGILLTSGNNEVEFMEFYLAGISYGVNVSKIVRVVSMKETQITRVAESAPAVAGVIYDQGKPIKLIDLKTALGIAATATNSERQLILITRFNLETSAYVIDGIQKIHRTTWEKFHPITRVSAHDGYITGTVTLEDRIVLIVDLERLLLDFSPRKHPKPEVGCAPSTDLATRRAAVPIIYAEDSSVIRRMTTQTLHQAGYTQVKAFENGQDALDHVLAEAKAARDAGLHLRERMPIVLTDIEMPRLDGLTFCKRVKSEAGAGDPPAVVVYSSMINEEMRRKCVSVGSDRALSKPAANEIVKAIDELVLA